MLRYFALSTALVVAFIVGILALPHRSAPDAPAPKYGERAGTPGPAQHDTFERTALPVTGDAPWALSALPECFHQLWAAGGRPEFARAKIPRAARLLPRGSLRVADCTLNVEAGFGLVIRGENRLRIPPTARFYLAGASLVQDRQSAGREDVRAYALRGNAVSFVPAPGRPKP